MPRDDDQSLGGEQTFSGKVERDDSPQSLGDEGTYAGGPGVRDTRSLGDQSTFGDAGGDDEPFDDGMEVVDLSARYTIEGVLGKGGMGEVQLATDTRLERKVAIKRMLGDGAKSRTAVSRFISEAKAIAKLDHDNIVDVYDYGRSADGPFLVMQYIDGGSLLERCREGTLPVEEAVDLICQICDALTMCHDAGVIHRDIKPANILMTRDGSPRLTDFGVVKVDTEDGDKTRAGDVLGTENFMPPEQRKGSALVDARSDLWALGATLYQMVSGKSPRVIKFTDVPQSLHEVLGKALEDEKDDRYQTAREFRDALRGGQQDTGSEELEEGSCPSCGTKNRTTRKFCRECAVSLEAECVSCSAVMPLWEKVCDSCGTKQADLLDERRSQMASDQSEAESLLKVYDFDRATEMAVALRDETDPRLQHLKNWAEKFLPQIEQGRQHQLERISEQVKEAAIHEHDHDYTAALRVLEKVPVILRGERILGDQNTAGTVIHRLKSVLTEIRQLELDVRGNKSGIDEATSLNKRLLSIDRLLVLQPNNKEIVQLKGQLQTELRKLQTVCDEACVAARKKISQQDYEGALEELSQINVSLQNDEADILLSRVDRVLERLRELRSSIRRHLRAREYNFLPEQLSEGLSLKSQDRELLQLKAQLNSEIAELRSSANDYRVEFQFASAIEALEEIPAELRSDDDRGLVKKLAKLKQQREDALTAINLANHEAATAAELTRILADSTEYLETAEAKTDLEVSNKYATASTRIDYLAKIEHERDLALVDARKCASEDNYKGVLAAIGTIDDSLITEEISRLKSTASEQQSHLDDRISEDFQAALHAMSTIGTTKYFQHLSTTEQLDKWERCAKSKDPEAQWLWADWLATVKTDPDSLSLSETMLVAAWEKGLSQAAITLSHLYSCGMLGQPDHYKAYQLLLEAAATGDKRAKCAQAWPLVKGRGVQVNVDHATRLMEEAATAEYPPAQATLAMAYEKGWNVDIDLLRAFDLNSKAASFGNRAAQRQLGLMYLDGRGCTQDRDAAIKWLSESAKCGDRKSCTILKELGEHDYRQVYSAPSGVVLNLIQATTFFMGSDTWANSFEHCRDEGPEHPVTIAAPYWISKTPITRGQYQDVMGQSASWHRGLLQLKSSDYPVDSVTWFEAIAFCNALSRKDSRESYYEISGGAVTVAGGTGYRLPTEAEWELACRAGASSSWFWSDDSDEGSSYAHCRPFAGGSSSRRVARLSENANGLFDMLGNVWEWCEDCYEHDWYSRTSFVDPKNTNLGALRSIRGGAYHNQITDCRVSSRDGYAPGKKYRDTGFRVVRTCDRKNETWLPIVFQ
jgi:serine/threonine protein kinase/formylglycine-generating enzyme required for sulfatase activity/TPR repeat protein